MPRFSTYFTFDPGGYSVRVINHTEQLLLNELKQQGIIQMVDFAKIEPSVLFFCGDRDRAPNALAFEQQLLEKGGHDPRVHHIAVNGGPANIVHRHFPDEEDNRAVRRFLMNQIVGSHLLKKLQRLRLKSHWPCGQGEDGWKLDFESYLHEGALATEFVRRELAGIVETRDVVVASGLHLHKPDEMSTYHFCAQRWLNSRRASQLVS